MLKMQYKSKFNTKIGRCSIEQLVWKFHHTKMIPIEEPQQECFYIGPRSFVYLYDDVPLDGKF